MQPLTYRKAVLGSLLIWAIACTLLVSPHNEAAAGTYTATVTYTKINGDGPVGGVIIDASHLLVPGIGIIVVLALLVATALWRGQHRHTL
jgi:hypothetical protein